MNKAQERLLDLLVARSFRLNSARLLFGALIVEEQTEDMDTIIDQMICLAIQWEHMAWLIETHKVRLAPCRLG